MSFIARITVIDLDKTMPTRICITIFSRLIGEVGFLEQKKRHKVHPPSGINYSAKWSYLSVSPTRLQQVEMAMQTTWDAG